MKKILLLCFGVFVMNICGAQTIADTTAYSIERTDTTGTYLQIYFTDGAGKFYNAKPMVALVDPNTNQNIKTFMRDVYENGEPKPVKFDMDGVFDVSVLSQRDIVLNNVPIEKNKLNKVILKVTKGSLIFTYQNNRKRPVDKIVKVRRIFSKVKEQSVSYNASEQRTFESGEYEIELYILPKYVLHTEVSFGAITEVQLPQEGALQINSVDTTKEVKLYWQTMDEYEEFMTRKISNNMAENKIVVRPGYYIMEYSLKEKLIQTVFIVRPNFVTKVSILDYKGNKVMPSEEKVFK